MFSFRVDNLQNFILDKLKNKKNNENNKFHKLNLKENEILKLLDSYNLKVLDKSYVINMPLLFHFKIFRSREQKQFNEHLSRRDGYALNKFGKFLHHLFIKVLLKQYCNVYFFHVKKAS